jgi:hypothetical protein
MLGIIFFAAGVVVGLHFKIFTLVPATLVAFVTASCSLMFGYSVGAAAIAFVSATIACQIGYLISIFLHSVRRERVDYRKHKIDANCRESAQIGNSTAATLPVPVAPEGPKERPRVE